MSLFMIIGRDEPIYELDMSGKRDENAARLNQFIVHAALDMVDERMWTTPTTYLKVIDKHNDSLISAYVTPGGARFMVLHQQEARLEEGVKNFCTEAHELYVKVLLNPFYVPNKRIESKEFDARIRALARRHLGMRE